MHIIHKGEKSYPAALENRVGFEAPPQLSALGNLDLLNSPKTGLFCSAKCPGSAILSAYDRAARWRDSGRCVVSGFHSPIEKECLSILLRGAQPIVICPARSIENMRVPGDWKTPLAAGRLLILSPFGPTHRRVTADLAARRNELVAALADEVWFAHITPGGQAERLSNRLTDGIFLSPSRLSGAATSPGSRRSGRGRSSGRGAAASRGPELRGPRPPARLRPAPPRRRTGRHSAR